MKNLTLSLTFLLLYAGFAQAQAIIKFSRESHDFGEVIEGKLASYEFEVTNVGNQPLIVNNVQASCGCTSPFWTKDPIMPGQTGKIKATYNSAGRPGPFNKTLTILSNAENNNKLVTIKGNVIRKEDKVYTEEQKKNSPKISIEKSSFKVGKLEVNQKGTAKITVLNKGIDPLEIDNVTSPCGCTTFSTNKGSIKAGESAVLEITIAPKQKGTFKEEVTISSSDINTPNFRVYLEGEAVESFSPSSIKEGGGANIFK
ncbi:MAG TPA: DUF1573 domain-containing protein [Catalimonadaceae bacterium]|nr:DUF1573 domain-containing protein [Catalimonadaceae bacterium]